jgi:MATE family multidrug resistance protein
MSEPLTAAHWHRRVWRFTGPIILSNLTLPIVGAVDTGVAGHLPGPEFLGGVAVAVLIFGFVFWTFGFLRLSTTGYVAQALGRADGAELRGIAARAAVIALVIAFAILVLQVPIRWAALGLIDAGPDVAAQARAYFDIRVWSAPATLGNYVVLGWLIGAQRTGRALAVQVLIAAVNVVLDIVFVFGFGWGIQGLAGATVVAEWIGLAAGTIVVLRLVKPYAGAWHLRALADLDRYRPLVALNRDLFVRTLALSFAFAVFTALGARLGAVTLAANEVLMMFLTFAAFGLDGFANAAEAFVGEAYGKRDPALLQTVVRVTTLWALIMSVAASLVFVVAGVAIIRLMTDLDEVRAVAFAYLPYAALLPLAGVWSFLLDGIFTGATRGRDMRNAMVISTAVYLPIAVALWAAFGNHGLWLGLYLLFILRAATLWVRYPALLRGVELS